MTEKRVSSRYAKAIIETANAANLTDLLFKDFMYIRDVCNASKELKSFIKSPVVNEHSKINAFDEIFNGKINEITLNFIKFLIKKGRGDYLLFIIAEFEELYNKLNNRIKVEVVSAIELDEDEQKKIVDKITENIKKTILPDFKKNDDIIGGLQVRIEDWVFDASLKSQLNDLYDRLSKN
jgi:F-type H+-transporting ATPase subunit delta